MQTKRFTNLLSLLIVIALLPIAGCAPRAGGGEAAAMDGIAIDLPAIVIDYDAEGNPSIGNMLLTELANMFSPGAADSLVLPPEQIGMMTDGNIQHVQVSTRAHGLQMLVNGESIPSIEWGEDTLAETGSFINNMGGNIPLLDKLLPLLRHIGLGAIVRFPVSDDAEAIPTYVEGESTTAASERETQEAFLAKVGVVPKVNIPVHYNTDGGWTVGGMTEAEWTSLTGVPWDSMRLPPDLIQSAADSGITNVRISTAKDGIFLTINETTLPHLSWDEGKLRHVIQLANQMGALDAVTGMGMSIDDVMMAVDGILPLIQISDANIDVFFPQ